MNYAKQQALNTFKLAKETGMTEEEAVLAAIQTHNEHALGVIEIETDSLDPTREYISLPAGWEVQTKGAGSSYRLLDCKNKERHLILSGKDWMKTQAFFTRMAKEINLACRV